MRMVSYPAALSQVAIVEFSSPSSRKFQNPPEGSTLTHTPWLWVYWPRRVVALEGQQSERVTHGLSNSTPWSTRSLCVFGMWARSRAFMSSASMNSMLGFGLATWRGSSLSGRHVRASERALSNANLHKMFTGPYHPPLPQHSVGPNVDRSDESFARTPPLEFIYPVAWKVRALRCLTGDAAGRKAWKGKHEQGEEGHVLLLQRIPDGERGPQEAGGRGAQAPRR